MSAMVSVVYRAAAPAAPVPPRERSHASEVVDGEEPVHLAGPQPPGGRVLELVGVGEGQDGVPVEEEEDPIVQLPHVRRHARDQERQRRHHERARAARAIR
jgi:hypothetical protein